MTALISLFWLGVAFASGPMDLTKAADIALSEDDRMAIFHAMVADYPRNRPWLEETAQDDSANARERWVAIRVLGQTGHPFAKPPLLKLCEDPMPAIRAAAAASLGDLGDKTTSSVLAGMLRDPAIIVRAAAADSLGQLKDPGTVSSLVEALWDSGSFYRGQSVWARRHYVDAMGEIGSKKALTALIRGIEDNDPSVVTSSLAALRKIVGYDFARDRTQAEHIEAWRRWGMNEGY
jgi:HEAT repeat protein